MTTGRYSRYERPIELSRIFRDIVRTMTDCDTPIVSTINGVAVDDDEVLPTAIEMLNFLGPDAAEGLAALQGKRAPQFGAQP